MNKAKIRCFKYGNMLFKVLALNIFFITASYGEQLKEISPDFSSFSEDFSASWSTYLNRTQNDITPSKSLVKALNLFKKEGISTGYAVDLGAGTGKDTLYLLKNHWHVLALDYSSDAIHTVLARSKKAHLPLPDTETENFNHMQLPLKVELINANLALPFVQSKDFPAVWQNVVTHIHTGGRFCGNFFGVEDGYAVEANTRMTFVSRKQLKEMFKYFHIESITSRQGFYPDINGKKKYWQIWDVVAKKI